MSTQEGLSVHPQLTGSRQPGTTFGLIFKRQPRKFNSRGAELFPALDARGNFSWESGEGRRQAGGLQEAGSPQKRRAERETLAK